MYRILVADDDKNEREGIQFLIRKLELPLTITEARNGKQALEFIRAEPFDILLTDIKMPFMDGLELTKQVRELRPDLIIVIISGYGEFEYAKRAITLNVNQYLLKPIEVAEFKSTLTNVIELCRQEYERDRKKIIKLNRGPDQAVAGPTDTETQVRAVDEVLDIIAQEFDQNLSLEYLAHRVHLSSSYLSHLFKKTVGKSIIKYINGYRLEKAKEFLSEENYKIVDIYRLVGFSDASYFGMAFKNQYGISPAQYRAKGRTM
ncbi:response regulator transcription factor [Cohnella silvisoli]|uniref:Response regulator n=1 Tax=Cohnella silvisoli TaxID=2873699 RepID=A0ABV1L1P2_9BACL|nr:response regulator [Cohnella silvisoli]MCD9025422.1 response regulator [Cohnella silvisoli]